MESYSENRVLCEILTASLPLEVDVSMVLFGRDAPVFVLFP